MDDSTRGALEAMLADLREFAESDDGTDKYPDHQYLTEDLEARIAELLDTDGDGQ